MEKNCTVTLQEVLAARDERALRQQRLLRQHQLPLISFTMNIAGSIKADEEICRAFDEGVRWIRAHLTHQAIPVLAHRMILRGTSYQMTCADYMKELLGRVSVPTEERR